MAIQKAQRSLTNRQAFYLLYAIQQWMWVEQSSPAHGYNPQGYFKKFQPAHWGEYLSRDIRDMAIRQARSYTCVGCGNKTSPNSTGDHIIPSAKGGPQTSQNFMPLCKRCNSSKGTKDLFEWWCKAKTRPLAELPKDIICMYARLMYQLLSPAELDQPAPDHLLHSLRYHFLQTAPPLREAIFRSTGMSR